MLRLGPGPGLSASRIPRFQAQGICAEGPSSVHGGSSRLPTVLLSPGKQERETGISPQHQQVPLCSLSPLSAHAFRNISAMRLLIGVTQLTEPGPEAQVRLIKRLLIHNEYDPADQSNDIALLEMSEPVQCNSHIQLVCVPKATVNVAQLDTCYVAGWGATTARSQTSSDILQEAKVHLINVQICNSSEWYQGEVHSHNLCAGYPEGGIDTCQGDSGGPLMCKDKDADFFWVAAPGRNGLEYTLLFGTSMIGLRSRWKCSHRDGSRGPARIRSGARGMRDSCPEPRGQTPLPAAAASDASRRGCLRHWQLLVTPHFDWVKYFPTPGRVFAQEGSGSHVCFRSLCSSCPMSLVPGRQFLMYINMF
ncbi:hypothetical protein EK904_000714 [Melospiza melodia maxima]|nr:hypothetical protein EK904_000714 [Melospiza melodia maxima]